MHRNHMRRAALVAGLILVSMASMACGDDETTEDPTASVVFTHNNSTQGALEILINDELAATVMPGDLTAAVTVVPGAATLSVRAQGATSNLIDNQALTLDPQLYLIAVLGSPTESASVWVVDKTPPEAAAEEHYVEVVNLRGDDLELDVFIGSETVSSAPAPKTVSDFTKITAGEANISLSFTGGAPTGNFETTTLAGGGASMILLGGEGMDSITLNVLTVK